MQSSVQRSCPAVCEYWGSATTTLCGIFSWFTINISLSRLKDSITIGYIHFQKSWFSEMASVCPREKHQNAGIHTMLGYWCPYHRLWIGWKGIECEGLFHWQNRMTIFCQVTGSWINENNVIKLHISHYFFQSIWLPLAFAYIRMRWKNTPVEMWLLYLNAVLSLLPLNDHQVHDWRNIYNGNVYTNMSSL